MAEMQAQRGRRDPEKCINYGPDSTELYDVCVRVNVTWVIVWLTYEQNLVTNSEFPSELL